MLHVETSLLVWCTVEYTSYATVIETGKKSGIPNRTGFTFRTHAVTFVSLQAPAHGRGWETPCIINAVRSIFVNVMILKRRRVVKDCEQYLDSVFETHEIGLNTVCPVNPPDFPSLNFRLDVALRKMRGRNGRAVKLFGGHSSTDLQFRVSYFLRCGLAAG